MNKDLTELLWNSFPRLYRGRFLSIQESLIPFGFDCGDGWFQIIWDLSVELDKLGCQATQVKEKYGGLRFYYGNPPNVSYTITDKLVTEAEKKAAVTCEITGKPGRLVSHHGWYMVRCQEEIDKLDEVDELTIKDQ